MIRIYWEWVQPAPWSFFLPVLVWGSNRCAIPAWSSTRPLPPKYLPWPGWILRIPATTEILLIDTPAGLRGHEFDQFARHADALIVPVVPSSIDLRATLSFIDMVRKRDEVKSGRMRLAMIANRVRERTLSAQQLDATLGRITSAAMIRIRDSQVYVGLATLPLAGSAPQRLYRP